MTWSNDSCLPRQVADCARQANHFVFSEMTCPAPFAKIFLFSPDPNQMHIPRRLVPPEGRSRVVTSAGRDAVDVRASGAQMAVAGRDEPRERYAACRMIGASCVRQNRVVLAPVAGAKFAEASRPDRADKTLIRG